MGEGVARRAVHLRHAAEGVVVLDPAAAAVGFADRASGEERPEIGRAQQRAGVRPRADDPPVEGRVGAPRGVERDGADEVRRAGEREGAVEREASDGDRHLDAVDEREPLLGGEGDGPEPRRLEGRRGRSFASADAHAPFAHEPERQVRERREIARGSDRALRRE